MKRNFIFAQRITAGRSGYPIGWDGVDDFSAWYVKNKSATSEKAALKLHVTNDIARTSGFLNGLWVEVAPKADTEVRDARGAYIRLIIPADTPVSGGWMTCALQVHAQGGLSFVGDFYAGIFYFAPGVAPDSASHVLRLESNPATNTWVNSFMALVGDPSYTLSCSGLGTANFPTEDKTSGHTTQSGWIKVDLGGSLRYIQLYTG